MAILQPIATDFLNSPDHSLSHRVFANDGSASVKSVCVDSSGYVGIGTETPTSKLHNSGSLTVFYRAITALRTLDVTDYFVDCTSGTFTVTLPTAVGIAGREYVIKNSGTGVITIATSSSQRIDANLTLTLSTQYEAATIVSDGANWKII